MDFELVIENEAQVRAMLDRFSERRMRAVGATTLTRAAKRLGALWQDQINERVDGVTPRTSKATFMESANAQSLSALVALKDKLAGTAPSVYLAPQQLGGRRRIKKFEQALVASGAMPAGYLAVPGHGAKLDDFGNVSRSQITQVISQLGQDFSPGYARTISKSTTKRLASQAKHGRKYVAFSPAEAKKARVDAGIYERMADGKRVAIFLFKTKVSYRQLLSTADVVKSSEVSAIVTEEFAKAFEESAGRLLARDAARAGVA